MKTTQIFFTCFLLIWSSSGCKNNNDTNVPNSYLEVDAGSLILNFDAGADSQTVTVNANVKFTAVSDHPQWCVAKALSEKTDNLVISVTKNESSDERMANVTISANGEKDVVITVTQAGATSVISVYLEVDADNLHLNFGSGIRSQTVTVSANVEFTAVSDQPQWCAAKALNEETDNLVISVTKNESLDNRMAKVTISTANGERNVVITVTQAGAMPVISGVQKNVLLQGRLEFTLNIDANIPIAFDLPQWISEKEGNEWTSGAKNYSFAASPLSETLVLRNGTLTVRAADASLHVAPVSVSVLQMHLKYRNPVIQSSVPDPTVIRANDGYFYVYGTEDTYNMPIYRSANLLNWTFVGTVFTNTTRPTFTEGGLWAPDINYINGQYVMYYSKSVWGCQNCGIGVATASRPEGPFTDRGKLFRSNEIGIDNSIDPVYMEDGGRKYLFWGSWNGIWGIELTDDGLNLKGGLSGEKRQIAGTAYEAAYIHRRGKYYYLFASIGSCCEGLNSTYTLVVGRAENLWGPYTNRQGQSMMQNRHEVLITKNAVFVGVGHCSQIVQDDAGNDWIMYHGVQVSSPSGRKLLLDKIVWVNDWPTVAGGTASTEANAPVFK